MQYSHRYIIFSEGPRKGAISEATLLITNQMFNKTLSVKNWRKDKTLYNIHGKDIANNDIISNAINYLEISNFIRRNGYLDSVAFNLPVIKCFWLDTTFDAKINFHTHDNVGDEILTIADGYTKQIYGEKYPITPKLTREGHTYTTMQPQLLERIVKLRTRIIENSHEALTEDWFFDLRTLISDSISLIEITLNQIYIMAEYNPLPMWKFDKEKLGERHGRKFNDKLGWIYAISGNQIGGEAYLKNVNNLRELRNHMMHFDPPQLVFSIEESTMWINQIIDVGWLLIKIRKAIGADLSIDLINFVLQKEAIFYPESIFAKRLPIDDIHDYASCRWPNVTT